ncbi:MAG: SirB2 family protein [Moraxellaceae bacterium]|nr:SirB2 family protein [Moraxellaceae bacterium]
MLAEHYLTIKSAHVGLVMLSGSLFFLRGLAVLSGLRWVMHAGVRYASYCIDTALLAAALMLLGILHLNPFTQPWLLVKLGLLVAYIVCGSFALKRARTPAGKAIAFVAALACFVTIYLVARGAWGVRAW